MRSMGFTVKSYGHNIGTEFVTLTSQTQVRRQIGTIWLVKIYGYGDDTTAD